MTTAEKLRDLPKKVKYNQLVRKYRKLSLGNQFHALELPKEVNEYTRELLTKNGFKVTESETSGYRTLFISW